MKTEAGPLGRNIDETIGIWATAGLVRLIAGVLLVGGFGVLGALIFTDKPGS